MKKLLLVIFCALCGGAAANAQYRYFDAASLPLYGKGFSGTGKHYQRFPDSLEAISRPALWNLSRNSAGMAVRFSACSSAVAARWTNTSAWGMNHMTDTAVRGLDLYTLDGGEWRFVNSGRPVRDKKENEVVIIAGMEPVRREYMLYLPLYCGLESLEIGVDSAAVVSPPAVESPRRAEPIVFYGTSLLQGACASRAGMAFTNIISRRLDRETVNFGFSGNAFLDMEVARLMAGIDAGCYVLDFVPNASAGQIAELMRPFYNIIRYRRPGVPVIFVEDPLFPHSRYDRRIAAEIGAKNTALRKVFDEMTEGGERDIYYVSSKNMIGSDGEATIDGIHFTDTGMVRYADLLTPLIGDVLSR
jgi:hypothetical protein